MDGLVQPPGLLLSPQTLPRPAACLPERFLLWLQMWLVIPGASAQAGPDFSPEAPPTAHRCKNGVIVPAPPPPHVQY